MFSARLRRCTVRLKLSWFDDWTCVVKIHVFGQPFETLVNQARTADKKNAAGLSILAPQSIEKLP